MEAIEIIKNSTLVGNVLTLPAGQLDRKLYSDVAKKLEGIGGKWNKKHNGFLFANDPAEILEEIRGGVARNLKKEFQFFGTPEDVAVFMVRELYLGDLPGTSVVLEPEAGDGALIKAMRKEGHTNPVDCYELNEHMHKVLLALPGVTLRGADFLDSPGVPMYDRIIANPPFSKNQDITHIMRMFEMLKPKGRIVTVASKHWQLSSNKKEKAFKQWIEDVVEANIYDLDSGRFKQSGTMVSTCILVIDK